MAAVKRNSVIERVIAFTETAAGIFLAAVTLLVFVNVMLCPGTAA